MAKDESQSTLSTPGLFALLAGLASIALGVLFLTAYLAPHFELFVGALYWFLNAFTLIVGLAAGGLALLVNRLSMSKVGRYAKIGLGINATLLLLFILLSAI